MGEYRPKSGTKPLAKQAADTVRFAGDVVCHKVALFGGDGCPGQPCGRERGFELPGKQTSWQAGTAHEREIERRSARTSNMSAKTKSSSGPPSLRLRRAQAHNTFARYHSAACTASAIQLRPAARKSNPVEKDGKTRGQLRPAGPDVSRRCPTRLWSLVGGGERIADGMDHRELRSQDG